MTYQPYLIANYATGLDKRLQPWLSADDALQEIYDGFVYRGTMSKRPGYTYFAIGGRNGQPYTESRIVNNIVAEPEVTATGSAGPYTFTLQNLPVRRGTVVITAGSQSAKDDGLGNLVTTPAGGTGTVNYTTVAVSVTFNAVVANGTAITATYDSFPGLPVMMIAVFITETNVKKLIVADPQRLNIYDSTHNILNFLGLTETITGITNAANGVVTTSAAHNLSTGDKIFIYGVVGMTQVNNQYFTITVTSGTTFQININTSAYGAYTSGGTLQLIWQGGTTAPVTNFFSWVNYKDKNNNPRLLFTNNVGQIGFYAPDVSPSVGNYVSYPTAASPQFFMFADDGTTPITSITCSQLADFKDRLLMLRTTENGVIKPQRIRISGTGQFCDDFRTSAIGAGFIDIPDGSWIKGAAFNRDDFIIFTETSTWVLKYTGNDTTPFIIQKIDESRGSDSVFSAITYLNRTTAASPRGLIITDGYRVERADETIPDFSFDDIDGENFDLVFAGSVDEDRDHYLIYPPPQQTESKRILVTNYEEDNYAIYRLSLSCMGTYQTAFDITWDDLLQYTNWAAFAADYGDWNSFAYSAGAPFSLGGSHHGEIWRLNVNESEDNPVRIRNITIINSTTVEVTTDWNNFNLHTDDVEVDLDVQDGEMGADVIFITGVAGMLEINNKQFALTSMINHNTFRLNVPSTANFSAYVSGGTAQRVIPFTATMKQFNPYIGTDAKVRCGWLYMYVDSTGTSLTRNIAISAATNAATCQITSLIDHNLQTGDQVAIFGVSGMTQLNDNSYFVTVLSSTTFLLNGIDSTGYGAYTSGGYAAVAELAKLDIEIITNDNNTKTQLNYPNQQPYQGTCTNLTFETGSKKWYKVYINQTGYFIQFRFKNQQAGSTINIQATMPGFSQTGRII